MPKSRKRSVKRLLFSGFDVFLSAQREQDWKNPYKNQHAAVFCVHCSRTCEKSFGQEKSGGCFEREAKRLKRLGFLPRSSPKLANWHREPGYPGRVMSS